MKYPKYRLAATNVLVICLLLICQPTIARAGLLFSTDFEEQRIDANQLYTLDALCCAHSAVIVNNPVRAGNYAVKVTLNSDDAGNIFWTYTNPAKRAELRWYNIGPKTGSERWFGIAMYVDPSWVDHTSDPNGTILLQIHGTQSDPGEAAHSPQFAIIITRDNRWNVNTLYDTNAITTSATLGKIVRDVGAVTKGVWINWVIHAKWRYDSTGLLEVWKDGNKVVNYTGPNTYNDNPAQQALMAFGIYKSWYGLQQPSPRDTLIMYYDQVKIGDESSNYNEVAPTGTGINVLASPTNLQVQ